ncbi:MAG: alpha/beta fold hydrolase [Proteobacteria bacterium]|nr:alpha/beta fold hydrolase [Pseudomonadota bacterium]
MSSWGHVEQFGRADDPPVLLLHSLATHGAMWSAQIPTWGRSFRVIVPDLPGHGSTPADPTLHRFEDFAASVLRLLDSLRIERIALVGLSLGGMIGQALALRYPDRVGALVLAHTFARVSGPMLPIWKQRQATVESQGMEGQVAPTLERWFTPAFRAASPLTLGWIADMIRATQPAGYCAVAECIQHLDYLNRLSEIEQPTLVVAGSEDKGASPEVATEMHARLPQARLLILPDAGHLGCVDRPVEFTERVGEFLLETNRAQ